MEKKISIFWAFPFSHLRISDFAFGCQNSRNWARRTGEEVQGILECFSKKKVGKNMKFQVRKTNKKRRFRENWPAFFSTSFGRKCSHSPQIDVFSLCFFSFRALFNCFAKLRFFFLFARNPSKTRPLSLSDKGKIFDDSIFAPEVLRLSTRIYSISHLRRFKRYIRRLCSIMGVRKCFCGARDIDVE